MDNNHRGGSPALPKNSSSPLPTSSQSSEPSPSLYRVFLFLGLGVAFAFFLLGLSVPPELRVRGDAGTYLNIASSFHSLSEAFFHVSEQGNGLPFLEYLLKFDNADVWVATLVILFFLFHCLSSIWFCKRVIARGWIEAASPWHGILVFLLLSYPSLVLHTTVPLTDTLGADLLIFSLCLMDTFQAKKAQFIAGILLGFAITVRPAYQFGILAGLFLLFLVRMRQGKKEKAWRAAFLPFFGCMLYILPSLVLCYQQFGSVGVRDPRPFYSMHQIQSGLKGARLLWFRDELISEKDELPVLPDPFMSENFYRPCKLESFLGFDDSSLMGCLMNRPLETSVFLVKKWIGLFDAFQMQPYAEPITPIWYKWLSRAFSLLAFLGQAGIFVFTARWGLKKIGFYLNSSTFGPPELARDSGLVFALGFTLTTLAFHLLVHVENRFALVLVPYALVYFCWMGHRWMSLPRTAARAWGIFGLVASLLFFLQVLQWDSIAGM